VPGVVWLMRLHISPTVLLVGDTHDCSCGTVENVERCSVGDDVVARVTYEPYEMAHPSKTEYNELDTSAHSSVFGHSRDGSGMMER
jgi:hypothetical protein